MSIGSIDKNAYEEKDKEERGREGNRSEKNEHGVT